MCGTRKEGTIRLTCESRSSFSYRHWMASRIECHEYMMSVVTKMSKPELARQGPSLLLTTMFIELICDTGPGSNTKLPAGYVPLYRHILQAGVSPNDEFPMVRKGVASVEQKLMVTPWLALLQLRAYELGPSRQLGGNERFRTRFWVLVEALLAYGADADLFFNFSLVFDKTSGRRLSGDTGPADGKLMELVSVSLIDVLLLDGPPNQAVVLDQILAQRGGWLWEGAKRAREILMSWSGVRVGLPNVEPAHRRISATELEGYVEGPYKFRAHRVYTRTHDITHHDSYMLL